MSRWFRHYAGMMRDEKLVRAAVKAKQPVERVLWVWGAILESAAEINDGGRYEFDTGEAAYFLRCDDHEIGLIVECLGVDGRLIEGRVARWGDRQYSSDGSAERQRRYRERLRGGCDAKESGHQHNGDATVTSRDAAVTPQENRDRARIDDDGDDARANRISEEAFSTTSEVLSAIGAEPDAPMAIGAAYTIQSWLNEGVPREIIVASVRRQMANKRDGPPTTINYFAKGVAKDNAMLSAPLPTVEITTRPEVLVNAKRTQSPVIAACDEWLAEMRGYDGDGTDEVAAGQLRKRAAS